MEPPALSFVPNTQGSSARPPHPGSLRCCPRPVLGPELSWGGVGVGVVKPGKSRDARGWGQNLLLGGKLGPAVTPVSASGGGRQRPGEAGEKAGEGSVAV